MVAATSKLKTKDRVTDMVAPVEADIDMVRLAGVVAAVKASIASMVGAVAANHT